MPPANAGAIPCQVKYRSKIESPIRDTNFPYPTGQVPDVFPPVDPHDM